MKMMKHISNLKRDSQAASNTSLNSSTKLIDIAHLDVDTALHLLNTSLEGLSESQARSYLEKYGLNEIAREKPPKWYIQLLKTFQNPLAILLIFLAIISLVS